MSCNAPATRACDVTTLSQLSTAVNTVLALDRKGAFRMASFQSQAGKRLSQRCGRKPDDMWARLCTQPDHALVLTCCVLQVFHGRG